MSARATLAALLCCILAACSSSAPKASTVLHVPPSGKCPAGYTLTPGIFTFQGKKEAACIDYKSGLPGVTDYLRPGESEVIVVPLEAWPLSDQGKT